MNQIYTAVVKQDGLWWIGWIEEVPGVNCQENTRDGLLISLRVTLMEALEMNRDDARQAAGEGYEEFSIAVRNAAIYSGISQHMAAHFFEKAVAKCFAKQAKRNSSPQRSQ